MHAGHAIKLEYFQLSLWDNSSQNLPKSMPASYMCRVKNSLVEDRKSHSVMSFNMTSVLVFFFFEKWSALFHDCLRRHKRVLATCVHSLHMTWLECTRQLSETKFVLKVACAKYWKWKCRVKWEIIHARNICFYLEILLGDPSWFFACM